MNNLNLFHELEKLLRMESRYCSEDGKLLKNAIVEAALALRPDLIKLLFSHEGLKNNFFTEVDGVLVFDKVRFQKFVMNKRFLPDSYTSFKNKIGLANEDEDFIAESSEIVLSWPYKDCVLEGGQTKEDAKRNEVFWNEILAPDEINRLTEPKVLTNFVKYDSEGEHIPTSVSSQDNYIIKGNNFLSLYSLRKKYSGEVKLIYIDPPFNTGNDSFNYNDSFNHSTWLTFMLNRLKAAKVLLKANGGIMCVHCDDNEAYETKILLDEIFGKDNHVNTICIRSSTPSGLKTAHKDKTIIKTKDFLHIYKRGEINIEPQYIARDGWDTHFSNFLDKGKLEVRKLIDVLIEEGVLTPGSRLSDINMHDGKFKKFYMQHRDEIFQTQPVMPDFHKKKSMETPDEVYKYESSGVTNYAKNGRRFSFISDSLVPLEDGKEDLGILLCDIWNDIDFQNTQNEGGVSFPGGKKPERLIMRLVKMFTKPNDLILDYYLGSGTTAAVAQKMGRRYIGLEQMDYIKTLSVQRLVNVIKNERSGISDWVNWPGGGSFVYCELATANQRFVDEIIKAESTDELKRIWKDMQESGFLSWKVDPKTFNENVKEFEELSLDEQKFFLMECLDKNFLYIPLSEINNKEFEVSGEDKKLNAEFYDKSN